MAEALPTVSLTEIGPIVADVDEASQRAVRLVLDELVFAEHDELAALLHSTLQGIARVRGDGRGQMLPVEYRYLMGNLTAIHLENGDDEDADDKIPGTIRALRAVTEGDRQQRWDRVLSLLGYGLDAGDREEGAVATMSGPRSTRRPTTVARRLGQLIHLCATAYPLGLDLLDPGQIEPVVSTLDATEPILITLGEGGTANEILLQPHPHRPETTVTWVESDKGYREPQQLTVFEDSGGLIGRTQDIGACFGAKLKSSVSIPAHMNLGLDNKLACQVLMARIGRRMAFFLRRARGVIAVTQGDTTWRYDPMVAVDDTFGITEELDEDGDKRDDEDTMLE